MSVFSFLMTVVVVILVVVMVVVTAVVTAVLSTNSSCGANSNNVRIFCLFYQLLFTLQRWKGLFCSCGSGYGRTLHPVTIAFVFSCMNASN